MENNLGNSMIYALYNKWTKLLKENMEPSLNIVVYIQLIFKSSLSAMRPHFVCLNWHSDPGATNVGFELSYIGTSEMN